MKTKITLFIVLALLLSAAPTLAQHGDRARLQYALEKTDELITRARETVLESGSERARNQFDMAVKLQGMAKRLFSNSAFNDDELMANSTKYTLSARQKAQRAIAITSQAEENEDYVRRRLDKADDLIRRIEDRVGDDASPGLRLMLDSVREKQQRAIEFFRNRRLKASLQLTLQVENSLNEAAEKVGSFNRAQKQYSASLERYNSLQERIQLSGNEDSPQVKRALENAARLHAQAENLTSEGGRYGRANQLLYDAIAKLTRLTENLREPAQIKTAIDDLKKVAEQLGRQVEQFGDRKAKEQYRNALQHLEKAGTLYNRGDYQGATAQVQAARQIMTRISKIVEEPIMIEHGLELLRAMVNRLEDKVAASDNPLLEKQFREAQGHLGQAAGFYRSGNYASATAQLELAERLLARIEHSLGE